MKVSFVDEELKRQLNSPNTCKGMFGLATAKVIHRRLNELHSSPNLETMRGIGNCKELKGESRGIFSIRLSGGDRMIFEPWNNPKTYKRTDGSIIWEKVVSVRILGIGDYHKK